MYTYYRLVNLVRRSVWLGGALNDALDGSTLVDLIGRINAGDRPAFDQLFAAMYAELRRVAQAMMLDEQAGHSLQATAVVHEMYGRMAHSARLSIEGRRHFFNLAAKVIRQVLLDHAKGRNRQKRAGHAEQVTLDTTMIAAASTDIDIESLHDVLQELATLSPRQAQVVEWKFFAGMPAEDIAALLGVSLRTVEGDWAMARIWLQRRLLRQDTGHD